MVPPLLSGLDGLGESIILNIVHLGDSSIISFHSDLIGISADPPGP